MRFFYFIGNGLHRKKRIRTLPMQYIRSRNKAQYFIALEAS